MSDNTVIVNKNVLYVYQQGLKGYLAARRDLHRANTLISKLQAENEALKIEKKEALAILEKNKRHASMPMKKPKKWDLTFVKDKLAFARLV